MKTQLGVRPTCGDQKIWLIKKDPEFEVRGGQTVAP